METPQGVVRAQNREFSSRAIGPRYITWSLFSQENSRFSARTPTRPSRKRHVSLSHPPQDPAEEWRAGEGAGYESNYVGEVEAESGTSTTGPQKGTPEWAAMEGVKGLEKAR